MKTLTILLAGFLAFSYGCAMPPTSPPMAMPLAKRSWADHPRVIVSRQWVQSPTTYRYQRAAPPAYLYNLPQPSNDWEPERPIWQEKEPLDLADSGGTTRGSVDDRPEKAKDPHNTNAFHLLPLYPQSARGYRMPLNSQPQPSAPVEMPVSPVMTPLPINAYRMTAEQATFLAAEMDKMVAALSKVTMELTKPPASAAKTLLQPNVLEPFFMHERPEAQAVFYEVLGIPMKKNTRLNRTKQELFEMSPAERTDLIAYIQETAANFQRTLQEQQGQAIVGFSEKDLP